MRNAAIVVLVLVPAMTLVSWARAGDAPAEPPLPPLPPPLASSSAAPPGSAPPSGSAPAPPAPVPVAPPAPTARPGAACVLGRHPAIDEAQARAAASVICDELRRYGVSIGPLVADPGDAASVHRIELEPLGRVVMVRVTHEAPPGTFRAMRRVVVGSLEELILVAPAIADATVRGLAFDDTTRAQKVVASTTAARERREKEEPYDRSTATAHLGVGVLGFALPAAGSYSGLGVDVPFYIETLRWAGGLAFRYADLGGDRDGHFYGLSTGVRWFATASSAAPVLGAGLSVSSIRWKENGTSAGAFYGTGSGAGAFVEAGFEAFRDVKQVRLHLGLRLDLPFYSLGSRALVYAAGPPVSTGGPPTPGGYVPSSETVYVVPITLNATLYFL